LGFGDGGTTAQAVIGDGTMSQMSLSAAPSARDPRIDSRIVLLLAWSVAVFSLVLSFGINTLSTDDAMRVVEVRDFLGGQNWFNLTQYRLDPPGGVESHWSRAFIDAGPM
jgi:hypothetical protein